MWQRWSIGCWRKMRIQGHRMQRRFLLGIIGKKRRANQNAIAFDSTNALFYAGLARSLHKQAVSSVAQHKDVYPKLKKVLSKAVMLDSTVAEVQAALGAFKFNMEWQWYKAEKHYKRAIELNPNSVNALIGYAFYLVLMGRFDEGIELNQRVCSCHDWLSG